MSKIEAPNDIKRVFDQPATYQIHVAGNVGDIPSVNVHVMELEVVVEVGNPDLIIFTGTVNDQTALNSLLNDLCRRNFCLLSVRRLN